MKPSNFSVTLLGYLTLVYFRMLLHITGANLDSPSTRPTHFHLSVLVQKSAGRRTHHTKTAIIVVVARVVVVAIRGTAIIRLVEPRSATFFMFAPRSILSLRNNDCDRSKNIFDFMALEMATMSLPTKKKTSSERRYFFSIGRYPHV